MPTIVVSSTTRPTHYTTPDMRFGTTFLSTEYRDYAVEGEVLIDKISGEIFMKRPSDGRIISFHQNKKYMHDLVLELRVLLTNNESFLYPVTNKSAYYVNTDYDLVAINDEAILNILENDTTISNTSTNPLYTLKFKVSKDCNGFFCRPTSRDCDKAIIEFMTNQFNEYVSNYTGSNAETLQEKRKLEDDERYYDSNVQLDYTLVAKNGATTKTYNYSCYVRLNEEMIVPFPSRLTTDFPSGITEATVTINKLSYPKFKFCEKHKSELGADYTSEYNKFIYPDKKICVNYLNVLTFVDKSMDINLLGNESLIATLDIPYVLRYMGKMVKLRDSSEFITTNTRPNDFEWTANAVWAEHVRTVGGHGTITDVSHEVDILALEHYITKRDQFISKPITEDPNNTESFLIRNK